MNGTSALAILAFIGQVWSSNQNIEVIGTLNSSLYYFALGVLFIFIAIVLSYFLEGINLVHLETGHPIVEMTEEDNIELSSQLTKLETKMNWYFGGLITFVFASAICYITALNKFVDATTKYLSS